VGGYSGFTKPDWALFDKADLRDVGDYESNVRSWGMAAHEQS